MADRERDKDGQFKPKYVDEDIIQAVRKHEPAGTQEVVDELGIARQSADYRLRKLTDENEVKSEKVGNSLIWTKVNREESRQE